MVLSIEIFISFGCSEKFFRGLGLKVLFFCRQFFSRFFLKTTIAIDLSTKTFCSEKTVLKKLYFFSVILGFWAKESEFWQKEHLLICQNRILRVQQIEVREKTREFYTVFITSWLSTNKSWDIRKKTSAFLKKLFFPSSEEFFAGNCLFEKLILF